MPTLVRPPEGEEGAVETQPASVGGAFALGLLGAGLALGQVFHAYYAISRWGLVAIALLAAAIAVAVGVPRRPAGSGGLLALALVVLAALSALSALWAESASAASIEAYRWALYAAIAVIGLLLVRSDRERLAVVVGAGVVGGAVAVVLCVLLAVGDGARLFLVLRLTNPVGYVNGQAAAFLLALWPALALAERGRPGWRAGLGASVAVVAAGLVVLTQSRGAILALLASIVVTVAVLPGRQRRGWLLVVVLLAVGATAPTLLDVYDAAPSSPGIPNADALVRAGVALLVAGVVAGAAWGALTLIRPSEALRKAGGRVLVAGLVVVAIGGLIAVGDPVGRVDRQLDEFTSLQTDTSGNARLLAGNSNRYDYWRVAVEEFRGHPVAGLGAGNYATEYFRLRRTAEDIRQPHSLELQALSELGVLGGAAVGLLLVALVLGGLGAARDVKHGRRGAGPAVAATGMVAAWTVHTSVDWIHLLPSVTGVALLAAVTLAPPPALIRKRRVLFVGVVVAVGLLSAAGLARAVLADRARETARESLATDPARTIAYADRAESLESDEVQALILRAAAYARLDDYLTARASLLQAAAAEPSNFIPRVLLGDLAQRRGDTAVAIAEYRAALERNPNNEALRALVAQLGG